MNDFVTHDDSVFNMQYRVAKFFIYNIIYYRILHEEYVRSKLKSEFWTLTIDAHLLQATLMWSMIYGSDSRNPIHWKRLPKGDPGRHKNTFEQGLTDSLGIQWSDWEEYCKSMRKFRNKYAAHRELVYKDPVPDFDLALKAMYYYDHWARKIIEPITFGEPYLSDTAERLIASTQPLVRHLMQHCVSDELGYTRFKLQEELGVKS